MANCIYDMYQQPCGMWEEGMDLCDVGCDKEGNCMCSDDENPSDSCFYFEDPNWEEEDDDEEH